MPEIEQTTTGPGKTILKWFSAQIDIRTVVMFFAAIIWVAFFWKDSHSNWDKTEKLEQVVNTKANQEDFRAVKEQVTRQYSTQSARDQTQDNKIEENSDWIEYQKGYQQALKDLKNKQ